MQDGKLSVDETCYDLFERLDNQRAKKIKNALRKKYPKFGKEKIAVMFIDKINNNLTKFKSTEFKNLK